MPTFEPFARLDGFAYTQADPEFYAPLWQVADGGREFTPSHVPPGWSAHRRDIWMNWTAADIVTPERGWKIHVSARLDRAQHVLDKVAEACFSERVSFKHIHAELFFLYLHHKHAAREQAGKFCAAYPADEAAARRLLDRLETALAGEEGPYVLTDRRYRDSRTVHYRWGAFRARVRQRPNGTHELVVRDASGRDMVDVRGPSFVLPEGVTDPFAPETPRRAGGPVVLHGYQIMRAIRQSNAGGTYEARDVKTGTRVFVKEARAHNGLNWDASTAQERLRREHDVLVALHAAAPGVCPAPLKYFREWEHEFVVTEFVEGITLHSWMAANSPLLDGEGSRGDFSAYYSTCERMLGGLDRIVGQIHRAGYRFGDISPGNILVMSDGDARLVDFEAASHRDQPRVPLGTDGYVLPREAADDNPFAQDQYGLDAIALALMMPLHSVMRHSPANMPLLRRDLEEKAPLHPGIWKRAMRCCSIADDAPEGHLPSADELDSRPRESLERFAEEVRSALIAMADPDHPDWIFPTVPRGLETNTVSVAYGAAGVLHALCLTGSDVPAGIVARFRRDATDRRGQLPPGLHVGSAGVAWVLAELGFVDEAIALLDEAARHPLLLLSTTIGEGVAGVGMAHLAMYRRTGDERSLELAAAAGEAILAAEDLVPTLGHDDAVGLMHGRAGLALFLYYLHRDTGEQRYLNAGHRLLDQEIERAIDMPDGTLSFPDRGRANVGYPYLAIGAAGVAMVATRYVTTVPDERLAEALPRIVDGIRTRLTMLPGLYSGLAGLSFVLAEHADWAGGPSDHESALSVASGVVKYAIPHRSGVRFLGDLLSQRYSAELWSGGAGVLLGLHRVLHGAADQFFTLDAAQRSASGAVHDDSGRSAVCPRSASQP